MINLAAAQELRDVLIGKNPLDYASRVRELDAFLPLNSTIKSAFDMALYDLAAKHANLPLYRFLGGEKRPMETDLTMGIATLEDAGKDALKIVNQGFRMHVCTGRIYPARTHMRPIFLDFQRIGWDD